MNIWRKLRSNGIGRDIWRMYVETKLEVLPVWQKEDFPRFSWREPWKWSHLITALSTTWCRWSPYTGGHIIMVLLILHIVRGFL